MPARTIAIYGGSFDPPHLAHQMACLAALACAEVDQVWLLPTYRHAFGKPLAPFPERVRMCELAAAPFGGTVAVSSVEEEVARARGAESRTYHTLVHLLDRHPELAFRLVVGEDILAERDRWLRWDDVARMAPPFVVGRVGAETRWGPVDTVRLPPIASKEVRERIARGDPTAHLLSRAVRHYIDERGLYR